MATHMVIDFNGYVRGGSFKIVEYALSRFNSETGQQEESLYGIGEPFLLYQDLSNQERKNFIAYFKQYGISWRTKTQLELELLLDIHRQTSKAKYIFVLNENQVGFLKQVLAEGADNKTIFSLDILGFLFEPRNSTKCPYHEHPYKNNCAQDNLEVMFRWLIESKLYLDDRRRRLHTVVDFSIYVLPQRSKRIKEFAVRYLNEQMIETGNQLQVIQPSIYIDKSPPPKIIETYQDFLDTYGIPWEVGTCSYNEFADIVKEYFKNVTYVYVRNSKKKKLLLNYIEQLMRCNCKWEIFCLDDYGYDKPETTSAKCIHHIDTDNANCAEDNAIKMVRWLRKTKMYNVNIRNNYLKDIYKFKPKNK